MSYAIVGGGISGLTAAFKLRQAVPDAQITIFEPAGLGGTLCTVSLAGHPVDVGAEAFIARRPEVPALLAELGMAEATIETTGVRPLIFAGGVLHPMPQRTINGIPSSAESLQGLVDAATLAQVSGESSRPMLWDTADDPAVADLVGDRFGVQVLTRSVDPMLSGVYAGSSATIGLRSAAPGLAAALDIGAASLTEAVRAALPPATAGPVFRAIDGGYQRLIDELLRQSRADVVRTTVSRIDRNGAGWRVVGVNARGWHADAVVVAVPKASLNDLIGGVAHAAAQAALRIPVASSAVLALAVPKATPLPQNSGVLVASGESLRAKAITLSSRKWGRPTDVELLRCSFGRFGDDTVMRADDDDLVRWAVEDLSTVFGVTVEPIATHVARWDEAMPQYGPGHGAIVNELRGSLPAGMALAGNYLDGIGVPACVASGAAAADRLISTAVAR
jgi:oxygen-dependent protoporphyrinogen oxidase